MYAKGILGGGFRGAAASIGLALSLILTGKAYFSLNRGPALLDLRTSVDVFLPFVPIFAIPYVSLHPYIYASFQTEVLRPVLAGAEGLTRMVRDVYASDNPYNDFPSLHTSLSVILAIHWFRMDRRAGAAAWVWTTLIVASTVLVKQHYVADLGGGILLAFVSSKIAETLLPRETPVKAPEVRAPSARRSGPAPHTP